MKQRQSIHALLQTLLSILLLAPIITQAEGNQPNLPNQPNPARQAPKPPELDANGRLIIQPPSRPTPRTQKYPTDWQNYFQQHNAYKYKATLYIKGHGVADRTAGYTPFSERAYNEIESVLGRAPLWNTQTWSGAIREQQQKEGSIEIVGHLTTHGIQKKGDYNGYALFWTITNRDSDTTQQTAFDAIYPEIKKYNARANGINKQKLTPAQREKAWQNWEKQLYAAAPRKPTDEQRETWRKAVEYSQREAAIRANRSQYEQAKEDFWKHLGQTLDDTTDHAQRVYKAFEEGAPADYSYASKSVYYANAMWDATTVAAGAITQGTGIDNAVATGYDHYTSDGVKQSINEKVQQYQQWAAEHPEANEYVKFAAYSGSAYAGYKGAAAIDAAWAAKAAAKENAKAAAQAVSREVAAQSRIAQNQAARKAANNAINERAAANASKPTPYKTPAAPSANAPKPAVPSANAPKPSPKPVANNPSSPKPVMPAPMPYVPAAVARSGVDDFAGAVTARAAQQPAKKADDVVTATAQKAKPNVGANDVPKKSTPAPHKSDVSKTSDTNKISDTNNKVSDSNTNKHNANQSTLNNIMWDEHAFHIDSTQIGRKMKHAPEFGFDLKNPSDRQAFIDMVRDIGTNPDKTVRGTFNGLGNGSSQINGNRGPAQFRIKGNDVVVTRPNGDFVTILRNGVTNPSVKAALNGNP